MTNNAITVCVEERSLKGKGPNKRLRKTGSIPGILYGHHIQPTMIQIEQKKAEKIVHYPSILTLLLGKEATEKKVLIKEVQYDYLHSDIIHVDFQEVKRDETITTEIPLKVTGEAKGIHRGGILDQPLWNVEIECLPDFLPEKIMIDVSHLNIGDNITLADVSFPEGVTVPHMDVSTIVVHVVLPRVRNDDDDLEEEQSPESSESSESSA